MTLYVGDAAGRNKDFSSSDRKFAMNCGAEFQTPEQFFLNKPEEPFTFDFNPKYLPIVKKLIKVKKISSQEMVLLVGSPASGKSTFCSTYFPTYLRINQDTLKTKAKCLRETEKALKEGKSIIIDNTNPSKSIRKEYLDLVRKYNTTARVFLFEYQPELVKHLNIVRERKTGNKRLPDVAFRMYRSRYERPEVTEGFQTIQSVPFKPKEDPLFRMFS